MIVVDASVVLDLLLKKHDAAKLESRLFDDGEVLLCPHLLDLEVAQVLRRLALARQMTAERGMQAVTDYTAYPLTRYPHDPLLARVWELRDNFTAYDAVYVALAESVRAPLLTRDRRLAKAPGHFAEVELI